MWSNQAFLTCLKASATLCQSYKWRLRYEHANEKYEQFFRFRLIRLPVRA